ncbi:hypothetical protein QFC19_003361 [Naganishia cerealis]|uniref:Uncharacterized protein n=1 Tax=Naganishia cerealis TaxID=610337 RepID=A0ACC2W3J2_9TREE|nr:hypothetical protein QFC19_003361 [Naganishia cerealis]
MLRALFRVSQRAVRIQLEEASRASTAFPAPRASGRNDGSTSADQRRPPAVGGIPGFWVEKPRQVDRNALDPGRQQAKSVILPAAKSETPKVIKKDVGPEAHAKTALDVDKFENSSIPQDLPTLQDVATRSDPKQDIPVSEAIPEKPVTSTSTILPAADQASEQVKGSPSEVSRELAEELENTPVINTILSEELPEKKLDVKPETILSEKSLEKPLDVRPETISPAVAETQVEEKVPQTTQLLDDVEQTPVRIQPSAGSCSQLKSDL